MEEKKLLISFLNINKSFDSKKILSNLDLKIYSNEILGLTGLSGSGKSTLLKILIGFYKADNGNIYYKNKDFSYNHLEIRKIVGFVSQENSFYDKLTVEENLIYFANLFNVTKKDLYERITYLLDLVNLKENKKTFAKDLSGGMKRRLEFAISLIHDPDILILDELFTGLDIKLKDQLWEVILKIRNSGVTVIICSHLLNYLSIYCDRVVILHNKKISSEINIFEEKNNNNLFDLEKKFLEVVL